MGLAGGGDGPPVRESSRQTDKLIPPVKESRKVKKSVRPQTHLVLLLAVRDKPTHPPAPNPNSPAAVGCILLTSLPSTDTRVPPPIIHAHLSTLCCRVIGGLPLARFPFRFPQHSHNTPSPSNGRGGLSPPSGPENASKRHAEPLPLVLSCPHSLSPSPPGPRHPPPLTPAASSYLQLSCSGPSDVGEKGGGGKTWRGWKQETTHRHTLPKACETTCRGDFPRPLPTSFPRWSGRAGELGGRRHGVLELSGSFWEPILIACLWML
ncbi:hypothetical protein LZ30DRAFT_58459 [Colletotrichum cereale]|nr:hypothetical protein LZ30DRAFT_58459 [Colletotrichum cereale]